MVLSVLKNIKGPSAFTRCECRNDRYMLLWSADVTWSCMFTTKCESSMFASSCATRLGYTVDNSRLS